MEKIDPQTPDLAQKQIEQLRAIFPECVTEGPDGLSVDFDALRQELSSQIVEGSQERYRLDWPGKRKAAAIAHQPSCKTLRPVKDESVDFDTTQNLFIEGDNLEALKLIQETYLGQVKMIYIDPPYNTGNDFIYKDSFKQSREEYEKNSGQRDEEGGRLVANPESNGRFHSDWLSMMYPRLKLARNLLADDGVIFISIDDGEVSNLVRLCEILFGQKNVDIMVWRKAGLGRDGKMKNTKTFRKDHEYLVVCFRNEQALYKTRELPNWQNSYGNPDDDFRGNYKPGSISLKEEASNPNHPNYYSVTSPSQRVISRQFDFPKEIFDELNSDGRIYWGKKGDAVPQRKIFENEEREVNTSSIFFYEQQAFETSTIEDNALTTTSGSKQLEKMLEIKGLGKEMRPKPVGLLQKLCQIGSHKDSIFVDFFAGTATSAVSLYQQNAKDGGNRRFIMVQLPEACDEKSEAFKAGYKTIAEISKERIRRAGQKILADKCHKDWNKDIGFRVLKIDESNLNAVRQTSDATSQESLLDAVKTIKRDRSEEDLLFDVMLRWHVDLTAPIKRCQIDGKTVFRVNGTDLVACFDKSITEDFVNRLTEIKPLKIVFRDDAFASDDVKINTVQIFKQASPDTEVRSI